MKRQEKIWRMKSLLFCGNNNTETFLSFPKILCAVTYIFRLFRRKKIEYVEKLDLRQNIAG